MWLPELTGALTECEARTAKTSPRCRLLSLTFANCLLTKMWEENEPPRSGLAPHKHCGGGGSPFPGRFLLQAVTSIRETAELMYGQAPSGRR